MSQTIKRNTGVVNDDGNCVFLAEIACDIDSPGRISAVVVSKSFSVAPDVSRRVRAVYLKVIFFCFGKKIAGEDLLIKAAAAEIIVAAVLTVLAVPGVRKSDRLADTIVRGLVCVLVKLPVVIEFYNFSHCASPCEVLRAAL